MIIIIQKGLMKQGADRGRLGDWHHQFNGKHRYINYVLCSS